MTVSPMSRDDDWTPSRWVELVVRLVRPLLRVSLTISEDGDSFVLDMKSGQSFTVEIREN